MEGNRKLEECRQVEKNRKVGAERGSEEKGKRERNGRYPGPTERGTGTLPHPTSSCPVSPLSPQLLKCCLKVAPTVKSSQGKNPCSMQCHTYSGRPLTAHTQ